MLKRLMVLVVLALLPASLPGQSSARSQRKVSVECVAGCGRGTDPASAQSAKLAEPFGVAFGAKGDWYICEYRGQRVTKVDELQRIKHFAGLDPTKPAPDTASGAISFHDPHGLVIGGGQMYLADTLNRRVIRIDLATGKAEVFAGSGEAGFSGDGGPASAARFNEVFALALQKNKLYLADLRNRRIRSIDLRSGLVSTVAGNGATGVPADGANALISPLVDPRAVAVDGKGNVYIVERSGNALRVVDPQGRVSTPIAPSTQLPSPLSANEKLKALNGPKHLCVDDRGRVLIADTENHLIRLYDPVTRSVTNILGTGEAGAEIVSGDPLKTQLRRPHGVTIDAAGDLYISDSENHRILKVKNW